MIGGKEERRNRRDFASEGGAIGGAKKSQESWGGRTIFSYQRIGAQGKTQKRGREKESWGGAKLKIRLAGARRSRRRGRNVSLAAKQLKCEGEGMGLFSATKAETNGRGSIEDTYIEGGNARKTVGNTPRRIKPAMEIATNWNESHPEGKKGVINYIYSGILEVGS